MRWFAPSTITACGPDLAIDELPSVTDLSHDERVTLSSSKSISATALETLMTALHDLCSKNPAADDFFQLAALRGYRLQLMAADDDTVDLDNIARVIYLPDFNLDAATLVRSPYFRCRLFVNFLIGLRRIDQYERGHVTTHHRPDQAVLLSRALASDAAAVAIAACFSLRDSDGRIWRQVLGSTIGDIARVFAQIFEYQSSRGHPDAHCAALAAAFLQWYRDPARVNAQDHLTLDAIDQRLCLSAAAPLMKAKVTSDHYLNLTERPQEDGSYLDEQTLDALSVPQFQDIADATNRAHLHQILRDMQSHTVQNVPFRDKDLARLIFPDQTD
jgi:hypothetical protein